jgi:hypothetical protein
MKEASRELLASREDVWRFLAEPHHLADWWPGITGVGPDRRGFAPGARWDVLLVEQGLGGALGARGSVVRRPTGSRVGATLLVTEIALYESWSWQLIRRNRSVRTFVPIDVTIRLRWIESDRTLVTLSVSATESLARVLRGARDQTTARTALNRLYDLVQTAATL